MGQPWKIDYTWKNRSGLKKWVTVAKRATGKKNGSHFETRVRLGKMGPRLKKQVTLAEKVTLAKSVTLDLKGHTWKRMSHLEKWLTIEKTESQLKKRVTLG